MRTVWCLLGTPDSDHMSEPAGILIVDANAARLHIMQSVLHGAGHIVRTAASGGLALTMVRECGPWLVLLSPTLPDMSGEQLITAIHADRGDAISVLLLGSSQTSPEQLEAAMQAGAEDCIHHPVTDSELLMRVGLHCRQRELSERLHECETRFHSLAEGLLDAVLLLDSGGQVLFANAVAQSLLQKDLPSLQQAPLCLPIDLSSGVNDQVVFLPRETGPPAVAEVRVSSLQWQGEPTFLVSLRDISSQQRASEALQASEQRYREMVENLPDLVFINRDDRVIYINPAGVKLLGAQSAAQILGRPPYDFFQPEFHPLIRQRIAKARERPMVAPVIEEQMLRLDGGIIDVEVTAISVPSGEHMDIQVLARDLTVRKRVERDRQALLERELQASHYYRSLFESAPGAYLVLTPHDYRIVAVSEAYLRVTMTRREALMDVALFDAFPDDPLRPDAESTLRLRQSLERVVRDKRADVMPVHCFPIRQPVEHGGDFEVRYWSLVNSPVLGPDGATAFIIHRAEDVTAYVTQRLGQGGTAAPQELLATRDEMMEADILLRSREISETQRRLEESQSMLRIASHISRLGAWSVELPSMRMTWSDQVFDIHDMPRGQALTQEQGTMLYLPEDREIIRAAFRACSTLGIPYDLELRKLTAKGRPIWVRTMCEAVRDSAGTIVRVQGAFQDITERKTAQEREQSIRSRLTAMLESMGEGFIALDREWKITYVNKAAEVLVGSNRDKLIGTVLWDAFPEAVGSRFETEYRRAIAEGVAVELEEFFAPLNKRFEVRAYPSEDGLAIYFRDITRARTLEDQVRQSQRLESVGQLTGGVAHDFNNLLTVIMGNAELLGEQLAQDSRAGALAKMIASAAQRGAELTQALLAFSRRQALDPKSVDVNERVAEMHALMRRTLGENIEIDFKPATGLVPALVDPAQLESALLNLCLNARDAMPNGGKLTIDTAQRILESDYLDLRPGMQPGKYVVVTVTDTGSGIASDQLEHVFEPFFTTKEAGKGTGLGLSMVYGFIKQSGGQVSIYSEPGEGTAVRMYLPCASAEDASVVAPVTGGELPRGSETILLVEDDELVRSYASDQLAAMGYRVLQAGDGPSALEILKLPGQIDLLFSDIIMPGGMNGRQLADAAVLLRPSIKVLFTSGYTQDAVVHHGRLDAGVQLLSKPYRRAELLAKVRDALDLEHG